MPSPKADLMLHPVRLRIAVELANHPMTPRQIAAALPDVPQASLYRQINTLLEGGLLEVTDETPVNGAVERTYALARGGRGLSPEEMRGISADEHVTYFSTFAASLIDSFQQFISGTDLDTLEKQGMSYNRAVIYLTTQERVEFQQEVVGLLSRYMSQLPAPDRQRFTLASIVIPDERNQPE
jgi:DNA-binding transcriptional ArsR family regulator